MAEKLTFAMQIFFLGLSVVMIVLFVLYGFITFTNRLWGRLAAEDRPDEPAPREEGEGLPPRLAAAIAAAISHHRAASPDPEPPRRLRIRLEEAGGSRWAASGRSALLQNSGAPARSRRR